MINKFNLSWLKFVIGSTSLFYIAFASILSCFIIFYFISGLLAFFILCGIIFGKLRKRFFLKSQQFNFNVSLQVYSIQFKITFYFTLTLVHTDPVFHRLKSTGYHSKLFTLKHAIKFHFIRILFDIPSRREVLCQPSFTSMVMRVI